MAVNQNLAATTGADYVGNETSAALRIGNIGAGPGLQVEGVGTAGESLRVTQNALGGASIAPLRIIASAASQAVLAISGPLFSTASINLTAGQTAFVIPVYHETARVFGYINVSKGVA